MKSNRIIKAVLVLLTVLALLFPLVVSPAPVHASDLSVGDVIEVPYLGGLPFYYVRNVPNGDIIADQRRGETRGVVLDGPVDSASLRWWKIRFEDGVEGWVQQGYNTSDNVYLQKVGINPSSRFDIGDSVITGTSTLSVGDNIPLLNTSGAVYYGDTGQVIDGPFYGLLPGGTTFYSFWQINFGSITGWVAENWLLADDGQPLVCSVYPDIPTVLAPIQVSFSLSSVITSGTVESWELDINGDGNAEYNGYGSPPPSLLHTFTTGGVYYPVLKVSGTGNLSASSTSIVNVRSLYSGDVFSIIASLDFIPHNLFETPDGVVIPGWHYIGETGVVLDGPIDTSLTITFSSNRWWYVRLEDGSEGWIRGHDIYTGKEYLGKMDITPSSRFSIGDSVTVGMSTLNVSADPPSLSILGEVNYDETGLVIDGPFYGLLPESTGFYHFWKVNYGSITGWSAENGLISDDAQTIIDDTQPVINQPAFSCSPLSFDFIGYYKGENPESQSLSIWNSGDLTLEWVISDSADWLTLTPESGSSAGETDNITVSVDTSGMSKGSYRAVIAFNVPGVENAPANIPVTLTIKSMDIVTFPDARLESVIREAIGKPAGDITKTDLAVITSLSAAGKDITDLSGIEYCTNLTTLDIQDNPLGTTSIETYLPMLQANGVDVLYDNPVSIILESEELVFTAKKGGDNPPEQLIYLDISGTGELAWTANTTAGWLILSPVSGISSGEKSKITVSVDISGMDAGAYRTDITINAEGADNSPFIIPVKLEITEPVEATEETITYGADISEEQMPVWGWIVIGVVGLAVIAGVWFGTAKM